jgi:hypothetical protein
VESYLVDFGGGFEYAIKNIIHMGYNCHVTILHNATTESNRGAYAKTDKRYYVKEVEWVYRDLNNDNITDLIETTTISKGSKKGATSTTTTTNYIYKNGRFVIYHNK